jgi:hypothetical protein
MNETPGWVRFLNSRFRNSVFSFNGMRGLSLLNQSAELHGEEIKCREFAELRAVRQVHGIGKGLSVSKDQCLPF